MSEGLFWGRSKIIYGAKSATWVGVLVKFCNPAIKPQYIIVEFEKESSNFTWQKTVIPGPHHVFNSIYFYVFGFGFGKS